MVQTRKGVANNDWLSFMKACAVEYKKQKAEAQRTAKDGGKKRDTSRRASNEQAALKQQLDEWNGRKEARQRELSHAHMKRSLEVAQKAEAEQKQRRARAQDSSSR